MIYEIYCFVGVSCWISAVPIECLSDSNVECSRGGKKALVYRDWMGLYVFPLCICVILIKVLIIHFVLSQKEKSDQYLLRSSDADDTCGSRLSRCILRGVSSCVGKMFTKITCSALVTTMASCVVILLHLVVRQEVLLSHL